MSEQSDHTFAYIVGTVICVVLFIALLGSLVTWGIVGTLDGNSKNNQLRLACIQYGGTWINQAKACINK